MDRGEFPNRPRANKLEKRGFQGKWNRPRGHCSRLFTMIKEPTQFSTRPLPQDTKGHIASSGFDLPNQY